MKIDKTFPMLCNLSALWPANDNKKQNVRLDWRVFDA